MKFILPITTAWTVLILMRIAQPEAVGQAVQVTASLETNTVQVGQVTTLRVYAQILPNLQADADRIFSWYIDLLNTNGAAAQASYGNLVKPASDNDPLLSSTGTTDGAHRRGIYDTFLNRPGAGVSNAVELLSVPVTGSAPGWTRFEVRAGTGVPLAADFLVAPRGGGGEPWSGGDYTLAMATLEVVQACVLHLQIEAINGASPSQRFKLTFTPCPGLNHTVEAATALGPPTAWIPLPGAPHNSGVVSVTNTLPSQFFRVLALSP